MTKATSIARESCAIQDAYYGGRKTEVILWQASMAGCMRRRGKIGGEWKDSKRAPSGETNGGEHESRIVGDDTSSIILSTCSKWYLELL